MRISTGGPGSETTDAPSPSTQKPGAVPARLGMSSAPAGKSAWRRLASDTGVPRRSCHSSSSRTASAFSSSSSPAARAMPCRVTSSSVGAEPAGHDHEPRGTLRLAHGLGDLVLAIAHHAHARHLQPQGPQAARDLGRVQVRVRPRQELVPDRHHRDASFARRSLRAPAHAAAPRTPRRRMATRALRMPTS